MRLNLSNLKLVDEREDYLEYVLQIFVALEEKIGENPNFIKSLSQDESRQDSDFTYVTIKNSDILDLINYFNYQKNTILKAIKLIKRCRFKFTDKFKKGLIIDTSWKDELQEFYRFFMSFKDELSSIYGDDCGQSSHLKHSFCSF